MQYICYSEMCIITSACECGSECCQGWTDSPAKMTILSDDEMIPECKNRTRIFELVMHHQCPFCGNYTVESI